jgi:BRCT domain type II-containing protein
MAVFPPGTSFLFVGKLEVMTREQARALVEAGGGVCPSAVSEELDYLVLGNENSPLYGGEKKPKQLKAEALIEAGAPIAVITEDEFLDLVGVPPTPLAYAPAEEDEAQSAEPAPEDEAEDER